MIYPVFIMMKYRCNLLTINLNVEYKNNVNERFLLKKKYCFIYIKPLKLS